MRQLLNINGLVAIAISAILISTPPGSASRLHATKGSPVREIAIATPERANDYGWNQQGVQAARQVSRSIGARLVVNDAVGYDNTQSVMRRLAAGGANLIIAQASGYNTVAPRIAVEYRVPTLIYDEPRARVRKFVADIETSSQQGAYLAGVLAAGMTRTNMLGIVISAADTNWYKQSGGYIAGARSMRRGIKFVREQIGEAAYDDAAGGNRVTRTVIAAGADVIFGMGDGASFGYLNAIENARAGHKLWFIDVIGDKTPIDTHHVLLSSVLWNFAPIFRRAVRDINDSSFGSHNYNLNDSDGISLLRTRFISTKLWKFIEHQRRLIIDGKIRIPLTPTDKAVRGLCAC